MKYIEANIEFKEDPKLEIVGLPYSKKSKYNNTYRYEGILFSNKTELSKLKLIKDIIIENNSSYFEKDTIVYKIIGDGGSFNNGFKNKDLPSFSTYASIIYINNIDHNQMIKDLNSCIKDNLDYTVIGEGYSFITDRIHEGTNNQAEISSIIKGLEYIEEYCDKYDQEFIIICSSDSQYVMKGSSEWIYNWDKDNLDDNWKSIYSYINKYNIKFRWTRGHTNNDKMNEYEMYNYYVDKFCNIEINNELKLKYENLYEKYKRKI